MILSIGTLDGDLVVRGVLGHVGMVRYGVGTVLGDLGGLRSGMVTHGSVRYGTHTDLSVRVVCIGGQVTHTTEARLRQTGMVTV